MGHNFNVGDRVKNTYIDVTGTIADTTIEDRGCNNAPAIQVSTSNGLHTNWWSLCNLELIESADTIENSGFEFNTLCSSDIDWELLVANLNKQHPIHLMAIPIEGAEASRIKALKAVRAAETEAYAIAIAEADEAGKDRPKRIRVDRSHIPKIKLEHRFVLIHKSLRKKAQLLSIPFPELNHDYEKPIFPTELEFSEWVRWGKKVHSAKWPKKFCNKVTITVKIPKL